MGLRQEESAARLRQGNESKGGGSELKKTRKQMAAEMGISVKTLRGWENDLWLPIFGKDKLTAKGFVLDLP
jgi:transcriptional regulator with XRE-family HTH domain